MADNALPAPHPLRITVRPLPDRGLVWVQVRSPQKPFPVFDETMTRAEAEALVADLHRSITALPETTTGRARV